MLKTQKSTWLTKEAALAQRDWWVIDLEDQVLGRAATQIATVLRGKHKPTFTPNVDAGDYVVAINAEKVKFTGQKIATKKYRHHTGYIGGLKESTAADFLAKHPNEVIERAVWGMLPKGPLGRKIIKKLKIYPGSEHGHVAQQPKTLTLKNNSQQK